MSVKTATCITCDRVLPADETVSGFCPRCLYTAGSTPQVNQQVGADPLTTSWREAFPQFEAKQILREEAGFLAMTGTLVSDEFSAGHGPAALLLWSGEALAAEGGEDSLLGQIEALRLTPFSGVPRIADSGDLANAVYLIAKLPAGATRWDESGDGSGPSPDGEHLASLLPTLGQLTAAVRASCGVDLRLDPALVFLDPNGAPVLVPQPTRPGAASLSGGESDAVGAESDRQLCAGLELGPYTLVKHVGEGGFGEVWQAQQQRPATRIIALKIVKHGLTSPRMRARFEVEQQALARLDHPNIARFFDGGTAPDGRPFFAMEWIEGSAITDYCRETAASLTQRLRLFDQVCEAVQHAHRKGIIHRDLKASNVMVTTDSGAPVVKVIDFGIAKSMEEPLTDRTLLTRAEEIVGTPASMSPEQAAGLGGAELDARTDVYGLGVLLYELLCDARPYDEALSPDELRHRIREEDPPRRSSRVKDMARSKLLRGDLDWIVMRCLEKEPERRYDSAAALADDLERHARDQPVQAGPPELSYRVRKYVRRHRLGLAAAGVVSLALLAGGFAIIFGLLTAKEERAKALQALEDSRREAAVAEAVSRFLTEELLALEQPGGLLVADPRNKNITLMTVLERAASRIEGRFDDLPEVEGVLRQTLATSFLAVGDLEKAAHHATKAAAILEEILGEDEPRTLQAIRLLASVRAAEGQYDAAEALLERIAAITGKQAGEVPQTALLMAESDVIRGDLLLEQGKILKAEESYAAALASSELNAELKAAALSGSARCRESHHERADVLAAHREAVAFAQEQLGKKHPLALEVRRRYARFLGDPEYGTDKEIGDFVYLARGVRKYQEELLGADHPSTLRTRFDLALAFGTVAPLAEGSLKDLEEIAAAAKKIFRDDHPELLGYQFGLATQYARGGNHQRAIEMLTALLDASRRSAGAAHPVAVEATRLLAEEQVQLGRTAEALASFRQAAERARQDLSPVAPAREAAVKALGGHLWEIPDRLPEAIELFHDEYLACAEALGATHKLTAQYLDRALLSFRHDRTGAAATAAAQRALQIGGTSPATIRSLLQLSVASQWCLRPSLFEQQPIPLPESYFRLLEVETMKNTISPPVALPPVGVDASTSWRYLILQKGEIPPSGWHQGAFDASAWPSGPAPLGFGVPEVVTKVRDRTDGKGLPVSLCLRHQWLASDVDPSRPLLLRLRCNTGVALLLNGEELLRVNLPEGSLEAESRARERSDPSEEVSTQDFLVCPTSLVRGENLLAARVFQPKDLLPNLIFSLQVFTEAPLPLDRLADFDPKPAQAHLEAWLPDLVSPIENAWRKQVECTTLAALGDWEGALKLSRTLLPRTPETTGRHLWFQCTALKRLSRPDDAQALFRESLPPRDPAATLDMIDLTAFYNARLDEPWHVLQNGIMHEPSLKDFPVGVGEFAGIRFDVRGILQLSSPPFQQHGIARRFPPAVGGIPIDQAVTKLHFLNASALYAEVGSTIATVVVHYEDGKKAAFPIRYWQETLTYMAGTETVPEPVQLAWRGPDPYRPGGDKALYLATWENPRPQAKVRSVDLRAEPSKAALFVVGMSIERP